MINRATIISATTFTLIHNGCQANPEAVSLTDRSVSEALRTMRSKAAGVEELRPWELVDVAQSEAFMRFMAS